jgi:hypothetical protein
MAGVYVLFVQIDTAEGRNVSRSRIGATKLHERARVAGWPTTGAISCKTGSWSTPENTS